MISTCNDDFSNPCKIPLEVGFDVTCQLRFSYCMLMVGSQQAYLDSARCRLYLDVHIS